jgi:WD40 repeat protein
MDCRVFRVSNGSLLRHFSNPTPDPRKDYRYWKGQNTLSPDGKYLAHISDESEGPSGLSEGGPLVIEIRDTLTGALVRKMELANGDDENRRPALSHSRAFLSSDGKKLAVVTLRRGALSQVDFYYGDTTTGALRSGGGTINAAAQPPTCAFSPDGMTLAVGLRKSQSRFESSYGCAIELWDTATGKSVGELQPESRETALPTVLAFSGDGTILACGYGNGRISLWDVKTKQLRSEVAGHDGPVTSLAFDSHGRLLISGGVDSTAVIWDVARSKH